MKRGIVGLLVAGLLVFGPSVAKAAEITITVTITAAVSISVSPTSWAIGNVSENSVSTTWTDTTPAQGGHFTVSNDGNTEVDVDIRGSNSDDWTISDSAVGNNVFMLGYGQTETEGEEPDWEYLTTTYEDLVEDLGVGNTYKFDLQFKAPSSTTVGGIQQTITVNLSAQ